MAVGLGLFLGGGGMTPSNILISIRLAGRCYNSVSTTVLHCDIS